MRWMKRPPLLTVTGFTIKDSLVHGNRLDKIALGEKVVTPLLKAYIPIASSLSWLVT